MSLPRCASRNSLGIGRFGAKVSRRSTARGPRNQHAMRGLAAHDLLPREGDDIEFVPSERLRESRRGRVADRETGAVIGNEIAVWNFHAGGRAVPREDHVVFEIDRGQIGQFAVARHDRARALEPQLLERIDDPFLPKGFPSEDFDAHGAEQGPHRHFHGARIGARHDRDAIVVRHLKNFTREINRLLQLGLAGHRTMRPAGKSALESLKRPARPLCTRARRKTRIDRPRAGFRINHYASILSDGRLPLGGGVPSGKMN